MFQQNCGRNITSCIHTPQCGVCIMCRALLWYDKKPAPDQISLSVRSQTGSSARKKKPGGGENRWCLAAWHFPSDVFFSFIGEECCPSVVAEVLKEASRWRLWHWRGGDMTLYGFCVSFLPVPVYGLTMRSPTSRLQTYDFRAMTNKRVLFQYGIKAWSFKGKVTVFFWSLWLCV